MRRSAIQVTAPIQVAEERGPEINKVSGRVVTRGGLIFNNDCPPMVQKWDKIGE